MDHLFVDQDAIPTLVEVKRSSDTRIRREVVGQLLEYSVPWDSLLAASQGLLDSFSSPGEEQQTGWVEIDREWAASVFAEVASDD